MLILVDQDGPLADFESTFLNEWKKKFPNEIHIPLEERNTFYVKDNYPPGLSTKVESIYLAVGFYRSIVPTSGAVEQMNLLLENGHDVRICTSPLSEYKNCVLEKYEWVEEHLGSRFISKMIITKDKTIVRGDVLFDDKIAISGVKKPAWKHIVFDYWNNQSEECTCRASWETLSTFIGST